MGEEWRKELLRLTGGPTWAVENSILRLCRPESLPNLQDMPSQATCLLDYLLAQFTSFTLPYLFRDGAAGAVALSLGVSLPSHLS